MVIGGNVTITTDIDGNSGTLIRTNTIDFLLDQKLDKDNVVG